jgi:hypothetical protein
MVSRITRDDTRQRLTITVQGSLTFDDLAGVIWWQILEGLWPYAIVYDETRATSMLSPADLRRLLLLVRNLSTRYGPRGPVAVASGQEPTFASAEMYASLAADLGFRTRAFRDLADAERWVGDGDSAAEPVKRPRRTV